MPNCNGNITINNYVINVMNDERAQVQCNVFNWVPAQNSLSAIFSGLQRVWEQLRRRWMSWCDGTATVEPLTLLVDDKIRAISPASHPAYKIKNELNKDVAAQTFSSNIHPDSDDGTRHRSLHVWPDRQSTYHRPTDFITSVLDFHNFFLDTALL